MRVKPVDRDTRVRVTKPHHVTHRAVVAVETGLEAAE
jgi:hypothetical protein